MKAAPGDTAFRDLMGRWATGVSLITSLGPDGPAGCTANALTSLSLEPPRLLVCFAQTARTLTAVRGSRRFCVNVLAADQEEICRRFATGMSHADKFRGVGYDRVDGTVVLEGCVATIVCDVADDLPHGDHAIVVGAVVRGAVDDARRPLIFFRRGYATVGNAA